jgi:RNA polymerase sigma-70 factor (ECF subfamily)
LEKQLILGYGPQRVSAKQEATITFEDLVDRHRREIYIYLCRMAGNKTDAEDLFQETLLRAFRSFPKLREESNHRAWLYKIATNAFLNHTRKRQSERITPIEDTELSMISDGRTGADEELGRKRMVNDLASFIAELPAKQRVALVQRKYEGLEYADIAANLKCSEEAARASVFQAIKKVKTHFEQARGRSA